jgi:hypothetical protein
MTKDRAMFLECARAAVAAGERVGARIVAPV